MKTKTQGEADAVNAGRHTQHRTRRVGRRLGIAAVAFFTLKGLLWLAAPAAYLLS